MLDLIIRLILENIRLRKTIDRLYKEILILHEEEMRSINYIRRLEDERQNNK